MQQALGTLFSNLKGFKLRKFIGRYHLSRFQQFTPRGSWTRPKSHSATLALLLCSTSQLDVAVALPSFS